MEKDWNELSDEEFEEATKHLKNGFPWLGCNIFILIVVITIAIFY